MVTRLHVWGEGCHSAHPISLIQRMGDASHSSNEFAYLNHLAINKLILANCLIQGIKVEKYLDFCLTDDKTWDFSSSEGESKCNKGS